MARTGHHGCCAASPMPAPTEQIAATSHNTPKMWPTPLCKVTPVESTHGLSENPMELLVHDAMNPLR